VPFVAGQPDYSLGVVCPVANGVSTTTIPISFTFGVPLAFQVELDVIAEISPLVSGAEVEVDYNTQPSKLSAITVYNSQNSPVPISIQSESEAVYTATGIALSAPTLNVAVFHAGNFIVGQQSTYGITVSNTVAATPTTAPISVTEILPAEFAFSMAGTGWICSGATCTYNGVVNPGTTTPQILVTVNPPAGFTGQITNTAAASGGGATGASVGSDPTTITQTDVCNVTGSGSTSVADVQLIINAILGEVSVAGDLNQDGVINVVDAQIGIDAALGMGCGGTG
jgi:hypothetical protein